MKPCFSIVLIVKNEAHTLPRFLDSVTEFRQRGGEMVVLDTGSADNTVQLVRQAGGRVELAGEQFIYALNEAQVNAIHAHFARDGEGPFVRTGQRLFHFSQARNAAAELASNDWVLMPDASDELLAFDLDFIDARIASGTFAKFSYWLQHATSAGTTSYRVSRFYDRQRYEWRGHTHEGLYPRPGITGPETAVECTKPQLSIRHIKDQIKARPYLGGLALSLLENPGHPRWTHYLGRELYYVGAYHSAIALLESHAALAEAWRPERSQSLCLTGSCREALNQADAAADSYKRAILLDPTRREPLLCLAELYQRQGDLEQSNLYAEKALDIAQPNGYMEPDSNFGARPHALLYWNLFWLGRARQAQEHWQACVQAEPHNVRFLEDTRLFAV